jgi:hypothetical protein
LLEIIFGILGYSRDNYRTLKFFVKLAQARLARPNADELGETALSKDRESARKYFQMAANWTEPKLAKFLLISIFPLRVDDKLPSFSMPRPRPWPPGPIDLTTIV